ncbi:MAG: hypothetical protein KH135_00495 [Firmicutes bacterium]|nr:hypothetical protein [Bacillota bacterium]
MKELNDIELTCKNPDCSNTFIFPAFPEGKHSEEECTTYKNEVLQFNALTAVQQANSDLEINNLLAYQLLGMNYLPNYCPECEKYKKTHHGKLPSGKTLQKSRIMKKK